MLLNRLFENIVDILLSIYALNLLFFYFDIFCVRKKLGKSSAFWITIFLGWQYIIAYRNILPVYINIGITTILTLLVVLVVYESNFWNKCVFSLAFNSIWMLIEILYGYVMIIYFEKYAGSQILGSIISKTIFLLLILALRRVFTDDDIRELPASYSIMLVLIPIGSIYIVNEIFTMSSIIKNERIKFRSSFVVFILFLINILIFYIYLKLADELELRRENSVYEQQLTLCEQHQQEQELSMLHARDVRHNMKNTMVSILAYAEQGNNEKIIGFIQDIIESGWIKEHPVANTGNIVIDSLISYWHSKAQKSGVDFSVDLNVPMQMGFKGADLCLILGNLLENALEAAEKVVENRYIRLRMKYDKNNLLIYIENSYIGKLIRTKDKKLKSTKENSENHGIGLESVKRAVEKYHGMVIIDDSQKNNFLVNVVLYGE